MALGKCVAKNVRAIRLAQGLSQKNLADRTGLTIRYISRLENTAPNLTLDVIERLSKGLNCEIIDLLGVSTEKNFGTQSKEVLDQTIQLLQSLRSRL